MKARIKRKIKKRPYLYNVGQVFKACDWLIYLQRGEYRWRRYNTFGKIIKERCKIEALETLASGSFQSNASNKIKGKVN